MVNNYVKLETRNRDKKQLRELLFFDDHEPRDVSRAVETMVHKRIDATFQGVAFYASVWRHCPGVPSNLPVIGD